MLQQSFTYQLASISENAIKPAAQLFERRFGLHVQELRVLRLIGDQPGVNFTTLAAQTRVERSATSRILSRLIKSDLVRRELDEHDARQFRLFITDKGTGLRERADPLSLELEELILSALSHEERQQFRRTLDKLSDWLEREFQGALARSYKESGAGAAARRKRA
jgi:DNA-binding MarR family transcriptional regulator